MDKHILIAIDGPSGAGKSTIARELAKELHIAYVDTGAMYRALAYKLEQMKIEDYEDVQNILKIMSSTEIEYKDGNIFLDGVDISEAIRREDIGSLASKISSIAEVRELLVKQQQEMSRKISMIMDGRDIGTVVLPNANHKFYIIADLEVRAERRVMQLKESGKFAELETVLENMQKRDYDDIHRAASPLKQADDAIVIDTTELSLEDTIQKILLYIEED